MDDLQPLETIGTSANGSTHISGDEEIEGSELPSLEMGGTSVIRISEGQNEEILTDSVLLQNGTCRICYAPAQASGEDPVLELGCHCMNDLRFGHQSCLVAWFVRRILGDGTLDCEICRSSLAAYLQAMVMSNLQEVILQFQPQGIPCVILLLRVPPEELDHLGVPLATPDFNELSSNAMFGVLASFERQAVFHRHSAVRRTENFMASLREGPLRVEELQARVRRAGGLRNEVVGGSTENLHFYIENEDMELEVLQEGPIYRVVVNGDILSGQQLENLLDELSLHINLLAGDTRGDLVFLPTSMHNVLLHAEPHNSSTATSGDVAQQATPTCRHLTYATFKLFVLHDPIFLNY